MNKTLKILVERHRHHLRMVAYVVLGISVMVLSYAIFSFTSHSVVYAPYNPVEVASTTLEKKSYTLKPSEPVRILIPKISVDAEFEEPLDLAEDKTIEVPEGYHTVGWYQRGSTPGELGPAIILGHVDSIDGAGVFYSLGQLEPGDTFTIERADGSVPEFEVIALERYMQDEFPTDLVYGPIGYAGIRLITCSGTFNKTTQRYDRNLVVYAKLKEPG